MQGRVAVSVRHVDYELQQLRGDGGEGIHVGLDHARVCSLVTGHAQPLLQNCGVSCPLCRGREGGREGGKEGLNRKEKEMRERKGCHERVKR